MSLFDVIYQLCNCFQEEAFVLAEAVTPKLIQCFNFTNEDQSNSIFSIIGKSHSDFIDSYLDCLYVVISLLKSKVEPFANEIISRSVNMVMEILSHNAE